MIEKLCVNHLSNKKGFTLVELVVAVTILGIISIVFFRIFSVSYTTITYAGNRNSAMEKATSKMELLYALDDINIGEENLEELLDAHITDCESSLLFECPSERKDRFCIKQKMPLEGVTGYKVTIVVFYNNGKDYISLNSFIKGDN